MIRILHMIGSLDIGGSQAMVINLYRKIDRSKIQFDFILDHPDQLYFAEGVTALGGKIFFMPTFKGKNILEVKKAWNQFFKEHPEYKILHSHVRSYASIYIPIAKKYGLKTIIHSHSTSNGKGFSAVVKAIMQYPLRFQADYFMACSDKAGKWLFGNKIIQSNKYMMIPNAINAAKFEFNQAMRNQIRHDLGVDKKCVIGHVGRLTEPKNHDFLIDIFYEMKTIRNDMVLLLVGDGDLRSSIENKIEKLGIRDSAILVGNKSNTYDYYQAMDLFIFPSLWEGLGIVAIEAQASGLTCFISDKIPLEADLKVGLIRIVSLEKSASEWAKQILNEKMVERKGRKDAVVNAGFDIESNSQFLQEFYTKLFEM